MFDPNMDKVEWLPKKIKDKFQLTALIFILDYHIMKFLFMCCTKMFKDLHQSYSEDR